MNCETIQDQLLVAEDLGVLPADLASHVQSCPACGAMLSRLRRIEGVAADLPGMMGRELERQRIGENDREAQVGQGEKTSPFSGSLSLLRHRPRAPLK